MLYRPEAFEPLTDERWDESRVRERIQAIVDAADAAFDPEQLWPAHEADLWTSKAPVKGLFVGAAGVLLALETLRRRAHADVRTDLGRAMERTLELAAVEPDLAGDEHPERGESSLFEGETGILLVAWWLTPSEAIAERLLTRVRENTSNEANELMWGTPGTLLAARAMHQWTNDERWLEAWSESAREVRGRRDADGLWTQHLGGHTCRYLGPIHGAVGNTHVLRDEDVGPLVATLEREAIVEGTHANWPPIAGGELVRNDQIRVQWCHGAPGILATTASFLPVDLVHAGAELIWQAGAHGPEKGAGLCHGTAGNGYALLKTFERTGDELWLERARRFALHALEQIERDGFERYSLFTGDFGPALFASDCIDGVARFPVLDAFAAPSSPSG